MKSETPLIEQRQNKIHPNNFSKQQNIILFNYQLLTNTITHISIQHTTYANNFDKYLALLLRYSLVNIILFLNQQIPPFMKQSYLLYFTLFSFLLSSFQVQADKYSFNATLGGANVVPVVATPASGMASAIFDIDNSQLYLSGSFASLATLSTTVAIYDGGAGVAGPMLYNVPITGPAATSGTFTITQTLTGPQSTQLFSNNLYVQVNSVGNPGGEIRSQLMLGGQIPDEPIPTMSQWGLLVFGLLIMNMGIYFVYRSVLI